MDCTLVTAFYPIRSKFPSDTYLMWAKSFLSLEAPIVLFTTPELEGVFRGMREGRPITIVTAPFEDLYMWKTYSEQWKHHHTFDHEAFRHSPELYTIWAQKAVFVCDAIKLNPFNTNYFFWCDIGAFREGMDETVRKSFPRTKYLPLDKIALCSIDCLQAADWEVNDEIPGNFRYVNRIVGGLWGGGKDGCLRWFQSYEKMLNVYFSKNRFAGKDQSVMLSTYLNDTSLAIIYRNPGYNDWFYFERLHSDLQISPEIDETYLKRDS